MALNYTFPILSMLMATKADASGDMKVGCALVFEIAGILVCKESLHWGKLKASHEGSRKCDHV